MSTFNDNPFAPRAVSDEYVPDQLIAGHLNLITSTETITGGALYKRGTVLGQITAGAAVAAAKAGGNTGNGTISAVTLQGGAKPGVYAVRFTAATVFKVEDPDGYVIETAGATGAAFADDIGFTITAGGTAFVAGDGFDITVAAGTGYTIATAAATDGSKFPVAILADDVDTTGGAKLGPVYLMGEFNGRALTLGAGTTLAFATAELRRRNIFVKTSVSAADPS
ncbi:MULTISPECIES: head decoration protein [Sphingomonas]|uniref:head decoration protein n=1 Tax=Sphingomonas TaxID=13687 RepID=UPI0008341084|nr:head decoration protein [Sphingomonas sp. CCH10-B3]